MKLVTHSALRLFLLAILPACAHQALGPSAPSSIPAQSPPSDEPPRVYTRRVDGMVLTAMLPAQVRGGGPAPMVLIVRNGRPEPVIFLSRSLPEYDVNISIRDGRASLVDRIWTPDGSEPLIRLPPPSMRIIPIEIPPGGELRRNIYLNGLFRLHQPGAYYVTVRCGVYYATDRDDGATLELRDLPLSLAPAAKSCQPPAQWPSPVFPSPAISLVCAWK